MNNPLNYFLGGNIMTSKTYQLGEQEEIQASIKDARIEIHLKLGERLCNIQNACDACGYCEDC